MSDLIASGVSPLDERLGGFVPRRTYLVCGSPGAGKSVACLEFLNGALERGESAALLTHDDPQDVIAQAAFLGLDLDRPLREEQFVHEAKELGAPVELVRYVAENGKLPVPNFSGVLETCFSTP